MNDLIHFLRGPLMILGGTRWPWPQHCHVAEVPGEKGFSTRALFKNIQATAT